MSPNSLYRLLLFADSDLASSMKLLRASLDAVAVQPDVEVAAIVDTANRPLTHLRLLRQLATVVAQRAFNPTTAKRIGDRPFPLATPARLARRHRVPLFAPGTNGVNDPALVKSLRSLRPDGSIVLMAGQVFDKPLLDSCGSIVNYHDGFLPAYRGVGTTAWSVHNGEAKSGFVFNRLVAGLDEGPILLQGSVDIPPGAGTAEVERAKTAKATGYLRQALDLLRDDAHGQEQDGAVRMFRRGERANIRRVGDPSKLTWGELQRRLQAFEEITLELAGQPWPVTRLRRMEELDRRLGFVTADGVVAAPDRIRHLPPAVFRTARSLRRQR